MSALAVSSPDTLTVDPELRRRLTALVALTAHESVRPILSGVCFDSDGAWATNSYAAGFVLIDTGLDRKCNVPGRLLKLALKQARKSDDVTLTFGADEVEVSLTRKGARWLSMRLPYIEGSYPNVKAVAGNVDPTMSDRRALTDRLRRLRNQRFPYGIAVPFLDAVGQLAGKGAKPHPVVIQHQAAPLKPVHVYEMDGRWLGLVMPQRHADLEADR